MSEALVEARDVTLLHLVDRAIDHGVILAGDITIAVADIDLIYLGLQVLLASVERVEGLRTQRERVVQREVREGITLKGSCVRFNVNRPSRATSLSSRTFGTPGSATDALPNSFVGLHGVLTHAPCLHATARAWKNRVNMVSAA